MFPVVTSGTHGNPSFPRVRGDVPHLHLLLLKRGQFSPRARGCSAPVPFSMYRSIVFPACAGMFLILSTTLSVTPCFPRVRGDVPAWEGVKEGLSKFSPRARGCSNPAWVASPNRGVFPACAGMFRADTLAHIIPAGFPRVRGDVPSRNPARSTSQSFSPRARGCSALQNDYAARLQVFPACAGMFPFSQFWSFPLLSFPRVRGDVPLREDPRVMRL